MSENNIQNMETGKGTILFGGSGFLGPYILQNYPDMVSVGRTAPTTKNRHVPVASLDNLDVLKDIEFNNVIFIIGNSDHYSLERDTIPNGEPSAFDYHVTPLIQTLEQLKLRPIKRFINFSSVLIYDEHKITLPVSEKCPIDPYKNRYTISRYLGEEVCKFYSKWVPITTVRVSNMYGPTPLKRFDLIHLLCHQLLNNGKGQVWNTSPGRDFIYVEDGAHAIVKLLKSDYSGILNLGTGTQTFVREIVDVLEDVSGCSITNLDQPVSGPAQFRCDMTKINQLIDWEPTYSTADGVRRTFEVMKELRGQNYEAGN